MTDNPAKEPIAIIGMACRFPGGVNNPAEYWELIRTGQDAIIDIPSERWNKDRFYHPDPEQPGKMYVKQGGFLQRSIHDFDYSFFHISPREAERLDPQQKLLLEVTWEALEDGFLTAEQYTSASTGVYVGAFTLDNLVEQGQSYNREHINAHTGVSTSMTLLSNRVSYTFNLTGPSMTVDTACSSSLVALHLACQGLWNEDCELALAGGVNAMLRPEAFITMCKAHFLSPDARCKTFDQSANGYVRGEGAGVLVLKPLSAALRDNDRIHAVILATGVNQDGHTDSIPVPSQSSQKKLIEKVMRRANITPDQLHYIEAHGTGTQIGDVTEVQALGEILAERSIADPCWIGSVKTNIGHLESAAGVASVIKTVLCLRHKAIPPHLHLQNVNEGIDFEAARLRVPRQVEALPPSDIHYAAVNAFGYGGTNAHTILRSADNLQSNLSGETIQRPQVILLSAHNEKTLDAKVRDYVDFAPGNLADYAYTLARKRNHLNFRMAMVVENEANLEKQFNDYLHKEINPNIKIGLVEKVRQPVFVYTGMGAQWWGMARELMEREPVFREAIHECDAIFQSLANRSLLELFENDNGSPMSEPQDAQPANFAVQVGLTQLWKSYGLTPQAVVGHSVGEIAAAWAAGVLDLADAIYLVWQRSHLQKPLIQQGGMLSVGLSVDEIGPQLTNHTDISLAAINSSRSVTLAGDLTALATIQAELDTQDIFARLLKVDVAYHSYQMEDLHDDLHEALANITPHPAELPLYSTVTGQLARDGEQTVDYWWNNCRNTVQFQSAIEQIVDDGYDTFIEIGPHPVLAATIQDTLQDLGSNGLVIPSMRRAMPEVQTILQSLSQLFVWGTPIDWEKYYPIGQNVKLPVYPWQRNAAWEQGPGADLDRTHIPDHPLLQRRLPLPEMTWEGAMNHEVLPYLADHVIEGVNLLPGACMIELALALANETGNALTLENVQFVGMLNLEKSPTVQIEYDPQRHTFNLYSHPTENSDEWTLHAQGKLLAQGFAPQTPPLQRETLDCPNIYARSEFYRRLEANGMQYGTHFQSVKSVASGDLEVLAEIEYPIDAPEISQYFIHPSMLDAGFQSILALLFESNNSNAYVPVGIQQFRYHHQPTTSVWCYGRVTQNHVDAIEADIIFFDDDGRILIEVLGIRFQAQHHNLSQSDAIAAMLYETDWQPLEDEFLPLTPTGTWLIFGDEHDKSDQIAQKLTDHNIHHRILTPAEFMPGQLDLDVDSANYIEQLQALVPTDLAGIIYCHGVDFDNDAEDVDTFVLLHIIQAVYELNITQLDRFVILTRGAYQISADEQVHNPGQHLMCGLGRVLANEQPDLGVLLLDLDPINFVIDAVMKPILHTLPDVQIGLRDGQYFGQRFDYAAYQEAELKLATPDTAFKLVVEQPGILDSLSFHEVERRAPAEDEIEVKIHASALNFKDIMKAMNLLPTTYTENTYSKTYLGLESAGTVTRVGSGVTAYQVGDEVVAIENEGGIRSYSTLSTQFVNHKPKNWDFEQSVVLINFVTAYYALCYVGRLEKGETVLIHSATGGVGLAAIQVANWIGATIFATAGTPEKHDFLREQGLEYISDSRSLQFVDDIAEWTHGRGVNVVLNTQSKEALKQSIHSLAPFGRFVDISKRDILENTPLDMAALDRNIMFSSIDIDTASLLNPELIIKMAREVLNLMEQNIFTPLPTVNFDAVEIVEAFKTMAQSQHIGKLTMNMTHIQNVRVKPLSSSHTLLKDDRTYLVTGGYSGLGLTTAQWLVESGAKHIVLVSRSGAKTLEAKEIIQSFIDQNVQVLMAQADISDRNAVAQLLAEIRADYPPLAGIFHSAMVLDDAPMVELNVARFANVLAPKAMGAWHLHELTQEDNLDIFMLYSSVSALIGGTFQGSYVSANAYLDGLAHYRRAQGLVATSVNWGMIGEVGVVARNSLIAQHLQQLGFQGITPDEIRYLLTYIVTQNPTQIAPVNINWKRWAHTSSVNSDNPLYSNLTQKFISEHDISQNHEIKQLIQELEPDHQLEIIQEFLIKQIAKVTRLPASYLTPKIKLDQVGLDSLMALEINSLVKHGTGEEFPTVLLLRAPSIEELAQVLHEKMM